MMSSLQQGHFMAWGLLKLLDLYKATCTGILEVAVQAFAGGQEIAAEGILVVVGNISVAVGYTLAEDMALVDGSRVYRPYFMLIAFRLVAKHWE